MTTEHVPFSEWCIVEMLGHRRTAGLVSEMQLAGAGFFRIDVPGKDRTVMTQIVSPSSIYCLTPTTEDIARRLAANEAPQPVQRWDLRLPRLPARHDHDETCDYGSVGDDDDDEESEEMEPAGVEEGADGQPL